MKQLLYILFFLQFSTFAQCDSSDIVEFPDVEAQFPGGTAEMKRFIVNNIEYPQFERCNMGMEDSRVYVEFIVCSDGSITQIKCIRGKNEEINKMAIDLVKKMPNWTPAQNKGEIVSSKCRLPITICLF